MESKLSRNSYKRKLSSSALQEFMSDIKLVNLIIYQQCKLIDIKLLHTRQTQSVISFTTDLPTFMGTYTHETITAPAHMTYPYLP